MRLVLSFVYFISLIIGSLSIHKKICLVYKCINSYFVSQSNALTCSSSYRTILTQAHNNIIAYTSIRLPFDNYLFLGYGMHIFCIDSYYTLVKKHIVIFVTTTASNKCKTNYVTIRILLSYTYIFAVINKLYQTTNRILEKMLPQLL